MYVLEVVADVQKTWYDDHTCLMPNLQSHRNTLVSWDPCEELMLEIGQIDSMGDCIAQTWVSDSRTADFVRYNPGQSACGKQCEAE